MDSKILFFSVVLFICEISTGSHLVDSDDGSLIDKKWAPSATTNLVDAGSFNGKVYFQEKNVSLILTRLDADKLCKENFLSLVSVESVAEQNYLNATLYGPYYWTSGMDSQTFRWGDGTNVTIPVISLGVTRLCLYYYRPTSRVLPGDCNALYRPLCQA